MSRNPISATNGMKSVGISRATADRAALQLAAQQHERKRIAQELHDTLLQGFTCVALKLDALTSSLPAAQSITKGRLCQILERMDEYLVEARRSIWNLRSESLETVEDLSRALARVSHRALEGTGIELQFCSIGVEQSFQSIPAENLVRICEEAIANAVKHAQPTQVEVTLEISQDTLQLRIRDDGCGFDPAHLHSANTGHFGLVGIQERVEALSGEFCLNSAPGRGTSLIVQVPISPAVRGSFKPEAFPCSHLRNIDVNHCFSEVPG